MAMQPLHVTRINLYGAMSIDQVGAEGEIDHFCIVKLFEQVLQLLARDMLGFQKLVIPKDIFAILIRKIIGLIIFATDRFLNKLASYYVRSRAYRQLSIFLKSRHKLPFLPWP